MKGRREQRKRTIFQRYVSNAAILKMYDPNFSESQLEVLGKNKCIQPTDEVKDLKDKVNELQKKLVVTEKNI